MRILPYIQVLWSKPVDKKLYNTRKTLTKAFTLGSEIVDGESGTIKENTIILFPHFLVYILRISIASKYYFF